MRRFATFFVLASSAVAPTATLDALNRSHAHPSARLALTGTGFGTGTAGSSVDLGGRAAIVSSWSETRIVAYIPEGTPLGTTTVRAIVAGVPTNSLPLRIGPRSVTMSRVPWRFELDDRYLAAPPVVAQDGTVYAKGILGHTYAIGENGALKWLFNDGLTGKGQISLASNGDIVVGGANHVMRLTPNGSLVWVVGGLGSEFIAGPTFGPDGRIYGATNRFYGGIGGFVLDANGSMVATIPIRGDTNGATYCYQVGFSPEGFYIPVPPPWDGGSGTIEAYDWTHNLRWIRTGQGQLLALPNGNVYAQRVNNGNNYGAYTEQGQLDWSYSFNTFGVPQFFPSKGPDGSVYQVAGGSGLLRFSPSGTLVYERRFPFTTLQHPVVTPNSQTVLFNQTFNLSDPRRVRAISQSGADLWHVDLPFEAGQAVAPYQPFGLSPSGRRAYLGTTEVPPNGDPRAYLYAFSLDEPGALRTNK